MSTISSSTTSTTAYKVTADTTGALVLQTGATPTTAVTIDASQGVGVGISTPRNFEVSRSDANTANGAAAAQYPINIRNTDTTANNWASIGFNQGASSLANPVSIGAQFASSTTGSFVVWTSGAEKMRVDSSGNIKLSTAGTTIQNSSGNPILRQTGSVIQVVNVQTQSFVTSTVAIPTDNTIPQNTEGTELFTLAITPTSATSKLFIQVNALCGNTPAQWPTIALFQDSTVNALAVNSSYQGVASAGLTLSLAYFMTAGTTSSTTFKIRFGLGNTGSMQINGFNSAIYGGVATTTMTIMEIAA